MNDTFLCNLHPSDGDQRPYLTSRGRDFGGDMIVLASQGGYYLTMVKGYSTWSGAFMNRTYQPACFYLLRLTPDDDPKQHDTLTYYNAEILQERETGKGKTRSANLKELTELVAKLATGYTGTPLDEWVIYEWPRGTYYHGHATGLNWDGSYLVEIENGHAPTRTVPASRILARQTNTETFRTFMAAYRAVELEAHDQVQILKQKQDELAHQEAAIKEERNRKIRALKDALAQK